MGQGVAPPLLSRRQQQRSHARGLPQAQRRDGGLDELHRIVNRQPRRNRAARRVDVEGNFFLGVLGFQKQELGGHQVGDIVINLAAQKNNPVLEQPRVDVISALSTAGLLDYDWNQIAHNAIWRGMLTQTPVGSSTKLIVSSLK